MITEQVNTLDETLNNRSVCFIDKSAISKADFVEKGFVRYCELTMRIRRRENRRRAKKNGARFVRQDAIEEGRSWGELGE